MKKGFFIILLISNLLYTNQQVSYETLKKQTAQVEDDLDLSLEGEINQKTEEKPIFPLLVGGYQCDKDIKLNSVRQDVMTNNNYNK